MQCSYTFHNFPQFLKLEVARSFGGNTSSLSQKCRVADETKPLKRSYGSATPHSRNDIVASIICSCGAAFSIDVAQPYNVNEAQVKRGVVT